MAKGRLISTNFWMDGKVEDDFTPEDKYAYLWCLTNPHTNLCGCYEVSIKQIAHELGYESLTYFERMFKSFMTISPLKYRKTLNTVTYTNEQTTEFEEDTERLSSHRQSYIHHNFV